MTTNLEVDNTFISFRIGTSDQANTLPFRLFLNLENSPQLQSLKFRLSAYNGANIPALFHVVNNHSPPTRCLKTNKKLDLIERFRSIRKNKRYASNYLLLLSLLL